jgi:hypothetical protein
MRISRSFVPIFSLLLVAMVSHVAIADWSVAPKSAASRFGDRSWKSLIEGQAHGSGAHKFRTYREAIRMAKSGQYDRIYQALSIAVDDVFAIMRPVP